VIRPDLILTDSGYIIAEIDSVPGGIGLTAWLNQTYAGVDHDVVGGNAGMINGFRSLLPSGGDIVISEESSTYRPEMMWLTGQLNKVNSGFRWNIVQAETYQPSPGRDVYRFFELFDLPNLPHVTAT